MKKYYFLTVFASFLMLLSLSLSAQVGINNDGANPDNSALLDVKSASKGILIPRMTMAERDVIIAPATGLMIYQTDQAAGFYCYNGALWAPFYHSAHYVGELYGGGVIFWLDQTGQHGLICSMADLSTGMTWSNVTSTLIGPSAQSDWNGQGNTNAIIGQSGHTTSAAKLCHDYINQDYGTGVYSDWYLPSTDQLSLMYQSKYQVNQTLDNDGNSATTAIARTYYWSSNEHSDSGAWRFDFSHGYTDGTSKSGSNYIRAFRYF
jgi:hypothetical protein